MKPAPPSVATVSPPFPSPRGSTLTIGEAARLAEKLGHESQAEELRSSGLRAKDKITQLERVSEGGGRGGGPTSVPMVRSKAMYDLASVANGSVCLPLAVEEGGKQRRQRYSVDVPSFPSFPSSADTVLSPTDRVLIGTRQPRIHQSTVDDATPFARPLIGTATATLSDEEEAMYRSPTTASQRNTSFGGLRWDSGVYVDGGGEVRKTLKSDGGKGKGKESRVAKRTRENTYPLPRELRRSRKERKVGGIVFR
jgi:hypothetical protein